MALPGEGRVYASSIEERRRANDSVHRSQPTEKLYGLSHFEARREASRL